MADRKAKIYKAKLAEQIERYDEMVNNMKEVAGTGIEMTADEINLLSVAYKNVIGAHRESWKIITTLEQTQEEKGGDEEKMIIKEYRQQVEKELKENCKDILQIIDIQLKNNADTSGVSAVSYLKMKGDYNTDLAKVATANDRKQAAENSLEAYKAASKIAMAELAPTNPIRLGLALNFSIFHYEVLKSPDRACQEAETAFENAHKQIDSVCDQSYKDTTFLMQSLMDNLLSWRSEMEGDGEDQ
ncbi:unnamed protein product [Owenia fusiformis]|uniref:14-3-3 domain-containing protein n=1 Tax=Owenia fusiformis TaxID=6347 RepID=A0A8J1YAK4_OWEFU|nr:unnamed protein product [Owenia fusiformis]